MQNDIQRQILGAFLIALRPLARILLQFGIGFREFSEIMKTAFVDVATKDYGLRGRPTNISRVAVMTGLTRKEVRRLREKLNNGDHAVVVKSTPLAEILHRWHSESEFLDHSNRPSKLPFSGDVGSFSNLVKRFGLKTRWRRAYRYALTPQFRLLAPNRHFGLEMMLPGRRLYGFVPPALWCVI